MINQGSLGRSASVPIAISVRGDTSTTVQSLLNSLITVTVIATMTSTDLTTITCTPHYKEDAHQPWVVKEGEGCHQIPA